MINVPKKDAGELQIERFGSHQFAPKSGKASEYEGHPPQRFHGGAAGRRDFLIFLAVCPLWGVPSGSGNYRT